MSKITTSADLFPCPLCGNQPRLVDMCGWEIECKCGVNLCLLSASKAPLVAAWNTRASRVESAMQAVVDQSQELGLYDGAADARDAAFLAWIKKHRPSWLRIWISEGRP